METLRLLINSNFEIISWTLLSQCNNARFRLDYDVRLRKRSFTKETDEVICWNIKTNVSISDNLKALKRIKLQTL